MTELTVKPRTRRLPPRLRVLAALLALCCVSSTLAQTELVVLRMPGVGLPNDQTSPLPTYALPGGNSRYGLEYRPNLREMLVRPSSPVVCFQPGRSLGAAEPTVYLDPNGVRYTSPLGVLQVGGHPYTPHKYGSVALSGLSAMAYDVPGAEFVVDLGATAGGTFCFEITQAQTPLTPEQAICGGGLTDDPKDGWTENSLFVGSFGDGMSQSPPDLELIPWKDATASANLRYGYLVRNNGGSLAQAVALRETVPADALRFQRSLSLEGGWTCRGYGGAKCDAWPSMLYEQGYMASNSGSIPPGGCLKFEAFRPFTLNPTGVGSPPSGVLAARVLSRDEPVASGGNNAARMSF